MCDYKEVYIAIYTNEGGDSSRNSTMTRFLKWISERITGSQWVHVNIGVPQPDSQIMMCYDVVRPETTDRGERIGGFVQKQKKSLRFYQDSMIITITQKQYKKLVFFLDTAYNNKHEFNGAGFLWNFLPLFRWFPRKGNHNSYFCAQLVAESFAYAGIIKLKNRSIITNGYINGLFDFFFLKVGNENKRRKKILIPLPEQMPIKVIWDIIENQCETAKNNTSVNVNVYSRKKRIVSHFNNMKTKIMTTYKNDENINVDVDNYKIEKNDENEFTEIKICDLNDHIDLDSPYRQLLPDGTNHVNDMDFT